MPSKKGGARIGAGRPPIYKEKLKKITVKVTDEQHKKLLSLGNYNQIIRNYIDSLGWGLFTRKSK